MPTGHKRVPGYKQRALVQVEVVISKASILKGLALMLEFVQGAIKVYSSSAAIARSCRWIACSVPRLMDIKVEIVSTGVVLPNLRRVGEES